MNINQMTAAANLPAAKFNVLILIHCQQLPLSCAIATVATPTQFITQLDRQFLRIAEV